jgi:hypothetical protein
VAFAGVDAGFREQYTSDNRYYVYFKKNAVSNGNHKAWCLVPAALSTRKSPWPTLSWRPFQPKKWPDRANLPCRALREIVRMLS